jgi:pentatricopeptide repeat protein
VYDDLLEACIQAGRWDDCQVRGARRSHQSAPGFLTPCLVPTHLPLGWQDVIRGMKREGVAPNTRTYNILLEGYAETRSWDDISRLLRSVRLVWGGKQGVSLGTIIGDRRGRLPSGGTYSGLVGK